MNQRVERRFQFSIFVLFICSIYSYCRILHVTVTVNVCPTGQQSVTPYTLRSTTTTEPVSFFALDDAIEIHYCVNLLSWADLAAPTGTTGSRFEVLFTDRHPCSVKKNEIAFFRGFQRITNSFSSVERHISNSGSRCSLHIWHRRVRWYATDRI